MSSRMSISEEQKRDAGLVEEYHKKSLRYRTKANLDAYQGLQHWFLKKHNCLWMSCIKDERDR